MNDLIVIGGGINGAGIASDAAGRGLSVLLLEAQDLACATSSASSKLIHGGLRYLEYYEFRLVSEALKEREVLLHQAPHITKPLRFRLPHQPHLRPAWMIRIGLFLYDHLGKRVSLPASNGIKFGANSVLKPEMTRGFEYSDCWVDDARLVVLNALEVIKQGGEVRTRTKVTKAWRQDELWHIEAVNQDTGQTETFKAKALVNATGPWVKEFYDDGLHMKSPRGIRLVKGSHIVVPKVHDQPQAYILQNVDNRIVFVIPWLDEFSIIGTTDVEYKGDPLSVKIDDSEITYLLKVYNDHFNQQLSHKDVVWSYSGVRPLCDDESSSAQAVTRDYTLEIADQQGKLPLLSVFGGKLTTYRKLAEHAVDKLTHYFPQMTGPWTKDNQLPGGDVGNDLNSYITIVQGLYPWLPAELINRYVHTYGTRTSMVVNDAQDLSQLGEHFGHGLYEAELKYLYHHEWARNCDDVIWRRTKLGMWLDKQQCQRISDWLETYAKSAKKVD